MRRGRKTDCTKLPPVLQRYDEHLKGPYSSTTRENYVYCLLMYHEYLQEMGKILEQIRRGDVESYINKLTQRREKNEITQRTIKGYAKIIKTFTQWLVDEEMLDSSEYYKIERYAKKIPGGGLGNDDVEALSKEDEIQAFGKLRDTLLSFVLWVGLNFGLRRIEYSNMRIGHIELEHVEDNQPCPRIKIENSKGHEKKTRYYYLFPVKPKSGKNG